jgi:integrase/recombinase XerD
MPTIQGRGQASVISRADIDRILANAAPRYRPIFAIAAFSGCRISEARTLKAENLNLTAATILFLQTKMKVDRVVAMHPALVEILAAADLPAQGYLFPSPRASGPISREAIGGELTKIATDLGLIGVSTHSFRRSVATCLHERGVDLKAIASVTGHKDLNSLSQYIEVSPARQRSAILTLSD